MPDRTQESKDAPIVDCTCDCDKCRREKRVYRMNVVCSNCSSEYITEHRFGDNTSTSVACPHCGVTYRAIFKGRVEMSA